MTLLKVIHEVKGRTETSFGSAWPMSNILLHLSLVACLRGKEASENVLDLLFALQLSAPGSLTQIRGSPT